MKKILNYTLVLLVFAAFFQCKDPGPAKVRVTVFDLEDRPVENARVRLFAQPGDLILEDSKFTDEFGNTEHEFDFEAKLDVFVDVENYSFYDRLEGEGEVQLIFGERSDVVINLHIPPNPEVQ